MGLQGPGLFSGGPHSAVNDAGPSPYTGGARVPAATPTDVGAGGFTHLKASAPPPILNTAGINLARHSRSANQRVVYARVVQMHNNWATKVPHTNKWSLSGTKEAFEYDQLQAFELAWSYRGCDSTSGIELDQVKATTEKSLRDPDDTDVNPENTAPKTYGHMTPRGFKGQGPGAGIERMLRLAATPWVEEVFENHIGRQTIELQNVAITKSFTGSYDKTYYDSEIDFFDRILTEKSLDSSNVLNVFDVNKALGGSESGPQGLNVLADGCFLISKSLSDGAEQISYWRKKEDNTPFDARMNVPKNLGGKLAQRALVVELRRRGLLSWQPDGICLSKFESSDSVAQNAAYDAQMSQLFNVAVQGPSITNVWTFDSDMVTTPGDKVFMLLVGTVRLRVPFQLYPFETREDENAFRSSLSDKCQTQDFTKRSCTLSDFRLMRATSSYLVEHSLPNVNATKSRCGLADNGFNSQTVFSKETTAREYILGGWCIGTVMDSAASRAVSHNMPHASQHTMAINVNVNIEWWDADQLHLAYQNKGSEGNNIIRTRLEAAYYGGNNITRTHLEAAYYERRPRNHVVGIHIFESLKQTMETETLIQQAEALSKEQEERQASLNKVLSKLMTDEEVSNSEYGKLVREKEAKELEMHQFSLIMQRKDALVVQARWQNYTKTREPDAKNPIHSKEKQEAANAAHDAHVAFVHAEELIFELAMKVINDEDKYEEAARALANVQEALKTASKEQQEARKDELDLLTTTLSRLSQPVVIKEFKPFLDATRHALAAMTRSRKRGRAN